MNLFKSLLFDLSYNHSTVFDDETVNSYLLNRTRSQPRARLFHIDCPHTNKRVCYCNLHETALIPTEEKERIESITEFLTLESRGLREKFHESLFNRNSYIKDRIANMDSIEDIQFYKSLYSDAPKADEQPAQSANQQQLQQQQSLQQQYYSLPGSDINPAQPYKKQQTDYMRGQSSYAPHSPMADSQPDIKREDSSLTGPPKRRRGRQLGYRKKKDNGDEEEEFACHYSKCGKTANPEDFLTCKNCNRFFHAQCNEPPLNKTIVDRFDWFCNECKICHDCKSNKEEHKMLICDICDRAFHMDCLNPPITSIPEGEWYCRDCTECKACGKDLTKQSNFPNLIDNFVGTAFLCDTCLPKYKEGKYCPVCIKVVSENDEGNFVCCDQCNLWVHAECENINEGKLRDIEKKKNTFMCAACRKKNDS